MFKGKPNHERCVWALFLFGLIGIPALYFSDTISILTVNRLGQILAFAIAVIGLDLIWGYCGVLSLCQAFFFALGGYAMGMYLAHHGGQGGALDKAGWDIPACLHVVSSEAPGEAMLPWFWKPFYSLPATLALGLLIPGLVAAFIGYFGFRSRVRGVYFAILTQAITVAAWLVFCKNDMKLCGTNGLTNFDTVAGYSLTDPGVKFSLYMLTLVCLIGVFCLCRFLVDTRLGRVLVAVRDDETNLRFFGYKPYMFKMFVFALAAALGGLGGMLYTPQMGIITPEYMTAKWSILFVIWVAVGGRGTMSGAVLGAIGVNLVYNFLTTRWPEAWPFVQGLLFVGVVLLFPKGIAGLLDLIRFNRLAKRNVEA
ncbi:MAG: urea ABC transporter permease subunit UrtC [Verrucomicrobiota bacterium]|nr:urea ABC transporter permease subunit UrtC [Verrucomicrobiota bacterium]